MSQKNCMDFCTRPHSLGVFTHDFLFESGVETWKGKVLLNQLLFIAMTVSGTQHENFCTYVGKVLGTQIQLQCMHEDEEFSVRKLRFNSEPKLECSIPKFYPNAPSKDRSLVIKVAIVRKSHLRCFVNPNLTFVLVGPEEKWKCLSKPRKERDPVMAKWS